MKTLKLVVFGIFLFFAGAAQAQVSVSIGTPPQWAPAGYSDTRYYYIPDVEAYYDVKSSMFIYPSGGRWIHRRSLPTHYRNYDLYGGYKVPMKNYHGSTPYANHVAFRKQYSKGYKGDYQKTIGEKPGSKNHSKYNSHPSNTRKDQYRGSSNGRDNKKSIGHIKKSK